MKKRVADPDDKSAEKKRLEEQLKAIKIEVKKDKAEAKLQRHVRSTRKRSRPDDDNNDIAGESDDFDLFRKPQKRVLNTIDKW
jgi:hypothetical protein